MNNDESGFTLVELLMVLALTTLLLTIGAGAVRHFWRVRALTGARDSVATQMRLAQQRSFSESFPTVYGLRFEEGTDRWSLVRYNDTTGACTVVSSWKLDAVTIGATTDFPEGAAALACRNAAPGGAPANEVAFFYPRGSASAGAVALTSDATGRTLTLQVSAATGRVSAL